MRILDKYLLKEFALPLVYCFDAFVMLWIVQDLLANLNEFIQYHARLGQVLHYYLIVLPQAFVLILPMSLLLAVLFCLSTMGKHNELIAVRASGVSVARMALPLLAVGALASLIVFGVNEKFVPKARVNSDALMNELHGKGTRGVLDNFFFSDTAQHLSWYARRFNPREKWLENVEVHEQKADSTPVLDVYAERAVWTNKVWQFSEADVYDDRQTPPAMVHVAETNFPGLNSEPPNRLELEGQQPDDMTSGELRGYIRTLRASGRTGHLPLYLTTLHYRYAFPLTCFIVMWIGIPLAMRVSRSGPMMSIGIALVLVLTFYFLSHITLAIGEGGRIPAVIAAWLTNVTFFGVGAYLLFRIQ